MGQSVNLGITYLSVSSTKKLTIPDAEGGFRSAEFNLLMRHKRNWGQLPIFIGRVPKQILGRLSTFFHKREEPRHRTTEEREVL